MKYAQIDDSGKVIAVSELSGAVSAPNVVPVPGGVEDPLGKIWDGAAFVEPAPVVLPRLIQRQEFLDRFRFEELASIKALATGNDPGSTQQDAIEAAVFWDQVMARETINLDSDLASAAKLALQGWGILDATRAEEVFT